MRACLRPARGTSPRAVSVTASMPCAHQRALLAQRQRPGLAARTGRRAIRLRRPSRPRARAAARPRRCAAAAATLAGCRWTRARRRALARARGRDVVQDEHGVDLGLGLRTRRRTGAHPLRPAVAAVGGHEHERLLVAQPRRAPVPAPAAWPWWPALATSRAASSAVAVRQHDQLPVRGPLSDADHVRHRRALTVRRRR